MPDRYCDHGNWCSLREGHPGEHQSPCGGPETGKPCLMCDCFMELHPEDPYRLRPEYFTIGEP